MAATITTLFVLTVSGLGLPAIAVGSVYLGMSIREAAIWLAAIAAALGLLVVVMAWSLGPFLVPLRRWTAGDRTDPSAAWLVLLQLPHRLERRTLVIGVPLVIAATFPVPLHLARPDLLGTLALVGAYVNVIALAALLVGTATQLLVREPAEEVSRRASVIEHIEVDGRSLRFRLVAIVITATWSGGLVVPALVLGGAANSSDYLLAVVGSGVLGSYVGWIVDNGLVKPTLQPLRDVMAATVRIRRGDATEPVSVSTLDEFGDLAIAFNAMQRGLREREALHAAFGSYVDPVLARRLVESGSSVFAGEDIDVTVFFADVRDFTSYSEGVEPAEAVALLNRLFDVVVPVLHEAGGHANHYLGDGLLAVFGAPQPLERHADAAVAAAVEIQRRIQANFGPTLRLGIGINTGPVIAGTVGGGGRHEFTVIGDTVNAAARVEQLTKETGDSILITEATRLALSVPRPRTTRRGEFEVRGKATRLSLHAVNPFPRSTR